MNSQPSGDKYRSRPSFRAGLHRCKARAVRSKYTAFQSTIIKPSRLLGDASSASRSRADKMIWRGMIATAGGGETIPYPPSWRKTDLRNVTVQQNLSGTAPASVPMSRCDHRSAYASQSKTELHQLGVRFCPFSDTAPDKHKDCARRPVRPAVCPGTILRYLA